MKIIKQEKNPFLEREDLIFEIESKATPSFDEVKTELGRDTNLTVIKKINTNFGRQKFLIEAVVYDNIEAKEKIETIPQKVRKKMEAEKKKIEEAEKKAVEEAKKKKIEEAKKAAEEEEKAEEDKSTEAETKTEENREEATKE